jgi:hypothetical protein
MTSTYKERIKIIRSINSLSDCEERRVVEWEGKIVGEMIEDFSHLDEMSKSCVFEYLLFRSLGGR